ncbi:hypothetical protein CYMTET_7444 [Cymbomonas tetramitiformis]|uniref:Uncharacterized protein n=1 Tax=Cymbomonas tetramitiformis TaxID=36881 RepID=A0AAE0GV78_9CHLO|nr:hypothetical protein CYMTET_7444 [Cymbomonas tetramitiformis]
MSRVFLVALCLFAAVSVDAARHLTSSSDPDCPQKVAAAKKALDDALAAQKSADSALKTEKASLDAAVAQANLDEQTANSAYLTAVNTYNTDMFSYNTALQTDTSAKAHLADVENACSQTPPPTDCAQQIKDAVAAVDAADKKLASANATKNSDSKAVDTAKTNLDGSRAAYDAAVAHEQSELARLNGDIQKANQEVLTAQSKYAQILSECPQETIKEIAAKPLKEDPDCPQKVAAAKKALDDALKAQKAADDALTSEKSVLDAQVAMADQNIKTANSDYLTAVNQYNSDMFAYNTAVQTDTSAKAKLADVENACSQTPPPTDCAQQIKDAVAAVDAADKTLDSANATKNADSKAVDTAKTNLDGARAAYDAAVAHEQSELARLNGDIQKANQEVLTAQSKYAQILSECPQTPSVSVPATSFVKMATPEIDCKTAVPAARALLSDALANQTKADNDLKTEKPILDAAVAQANLDQQAANSAFLTAQNKYNTDMFTYNTDNQQFQSAKAHLADVENACSQTPPPTDCGQKIKDAVVALDAANATLQAEVKVVDSDKKAVDTAKTNQAGAQAAYQAAVDHETQELSRLNAVIQSANLAVLSAQQNLAQVLQQCPQIVKDLIKEVLILS